MHSSYVMLKLSFIRIVYKGEDRNGSICQMISVLLVFSNLLLIDFHHSSYGEKYHEIGFSASI